MLKGAGGRRNIPSPAPVLLFFRSLEERRRLFRRRRGILRINSREVFGTELETLKETILRLGADRVGAVRVADMKFDPAFRDLCRSNACGMYGKNWMCPPDIGPVEDLICEVQSHRTAVVWQTVDELEDSYDFEGMLRAGERINRLSRSVRRFLRERKIERFLLLGAGGCRLCKRCAKLDGLPCRFPDEAMSSLEAYGINVSALAPLAGMKYINGENTVTYFGAALLGKRDENG